MSDELKSLFQGLAVGCSFVALTLGLIQENVIATAVLGVLALVFVCIPMFTKKEPK